MTCIALFHSVLGLRPVELTAAERLRAAGHEVVTPDLYGGETAATLDEGFAVKDRIGWDTLAERAHDGLSIQLHAADTDDFAPLAALPGWLEAATRAGADARVFTYPRAGHFYTDASLPDHDEEASAFTWQRILEFLAHPSG